MHELVFSDAANNDLVGIVEYIARDSVANAEKYHEKILKQLQQLSVEPLIGASSRIAKLKTMGLFKIFYPSLNRGGGIL